MKKLLLFLLCIPFLLPAQDFYWHRTTMGVAIAPEVTSIIRNNVEFDQSFNNVDAGPGFSVGPRLQFPLSQRFFLRTSAMLTERNFTISGGFPFFGPDIVFIDEPTIVNLPPDVRFSPDFFFFDPVDKNVELISTDLTVELGYMFTGKLINWYLTTGPKYHFYISEKIEERSQLSSNLDAAVITQNTGVNLSDSHLSWQFGAGMAVRLGANIQFFADTNLFYNIEGTVLGDSRFEQYKALSLSTGLNFALY
jgi:hypothetical protein